jgi:hypothetical protein
LKQPFDETRVAKSRDPVDAPSLGFDWDEIYRVLDDEMPEREADKLLDELLVRLLQFLIPKRPERLSARSLGLRVLALAWVLSPGFFEGTPSLRRLARRVNVSPSKLSRHTGRISRLLRWRNRAQQHAWNWNKGQRSRLK